MSPEPGPLPASARLGDVFSALHAKEFPIVVAACRVQARRRWLKRLMVAATRGGDGWALALILPIGFSFEPVRSQAALVVGLLAGIATAVLVHGLKHLVRRRRPEGEGLRQPIDAPDRWAFPSGHTAQSFSVLVALLWLHPLIGLFFLPVIVAVGLSRVFLGVHYPSDVVVGLLIGSVLTVGVFAACQVSGFVDAIIRMGPLG